MMSWETDMVKKDVMVSHRQKKYIEQNEVICFGSSTSATEFSFQVVLDVAKRWAPAYYIKFVGLTTSRKSTYWSLHVQKTNQYREVKELCNLIGWPCRTKVYLKK